MPLTMVCGTIGALSISAFPLTSGFVSKSMVSQAALDGHLEIVWLLLAAASAGVFLHAGIKFPWFVFFQKDSGLRPPDPPWSQRLAMLFYSALCIGLGVFYEPLYRMLPFPVDYVPYTGPHVVGMLQLLLFSGLAFFVMLPLLKRTLTITLDTDWIYRRLGPALVFALERVVMPVDRMLRSATLATTRAGVRLASLALGEGGRRARAPTTATMVMWIAVLLTLYMLVYFASRR
jgi:multicomponent Na+:H+ antiporter subunit D